MCAGGQSAKWLFKNVAVLDLMPNMRPPRNFKSKMYLFGSPLFIGSSNETIGRLSVFVRGYVSVVSGSRDSFVEYASRC